MSKTNFFETPRVEIENCNGTRDVSLLTNDLAHRIIHIDGEINDELTNSFVMQMNHLCETDEPIKIFINSLGGSVNQGLVIYDVIQSCKNTIDMYCIGMAASMAAIILCGGQKGHRHILKNSQVMIHEPLITEGVGGSATDISNTSKSINKVKDQLVDILHIHTGKSVKTIQKAIKFNNFMNAEEAIKFGLVDDVRGVLD